MPKRDPAALSKRSRAQHNAEPVLPPVEPSPGQEAFDGMQQQETAAAPATEPTTSAPPESRPRGRRAAPPEGSQFIGVGVPREWWQDARAAFVTDFYDDEDAAPATFRLWVTRAVTQYVEQGSAQRVALAGKHVEPRGTKINREVALPAALVEQIETSRREDGRATRSPVSRSTFISTAMRLASEATRARHDGHLDPAPAKLPTRGISA